jgi:hypothetical protein
MDYEDKIIMWIILGVILLIGGKVLVHLPTRGSHVGYVTAVDDGIFCTKVYFKTDLESSQEDVYAIPKHGETMEDLKEARDNKSNVKITYKEIFISPCGRDIYKVESI